MNPQDLPIRQHGGKLLKLLRKHDTVVVIGEAGSGKTTQIPQILLEAGYGRDGLIGITQPRRVAAISAARRVCQEMGCCLGMEVGYAVRFDDNSSPDTKIKYLTDGTLVRECLSDQQLGKYSVVMLDEAHERSLSTDILFGVISGFQKERSQPLKILITSATLDGEKFSSYFGGCPVLSVPGSCFPVEIIHSTVDHLENYIAAAIDVVLEIHQNQPAGDILLFMTGQSEIHKVVKRLNDEVAELPGGTCGPLQVLPLYAALPMEQQALVFSPTPEGCRRCVVATNIAETSITVDGIVYVIDPGTVKQKMYHPETGMDSLDVVTISRVQAKQRAGRAGRTRDGVCYRLYSKDFYEKSMAEAGLPEIQRTSLVSAVLYLKNLDMGIDVLGFNYLDPPEVTQLEDGLRQLLILEAIDVDGKITDLGREMSRLPVDPAIARALIAAEELGCVNDMITIAAMLSVDNIFSGQGPHMTGRTSDDKHPGVKRECSSSLSKDVPGDHIFFLRVFDEWESRGSSKAWCEKEGLDFRAMKFAMDVRRQIGRMMRTMDSRREDEGKHSSGSPLVDGSHRKWRKIDRGRSQPVVTGSGNYRPVRKALTLGFANRIAHRMEMHNGYRPLKPGATLAQLHPSSAKIAVDEDGLWPEWVIYHEHVVTSRPFLRKVCGVDGDWVSEVLPRLKVVDIKRLSDGKIHTDKGSELESTDKSKEGGKCVIRKENSQRKNNDTQISDARKRYLERKAARLK